MKLPRAHHLSPSEVAGNLVLTSIRLDDANRDGDTVQTARTLVEHHHIGGFLIETGSAAAVRFFTDYLSRIARFPLFFAVEMVPSLENGDVECTPFPSLLSIGAIGEHESLRAVIEALGDELRAMGLNMVFVPLLNRAILSRENAIQPPAYHAETGRIQQAVIVAWEVLTRKGIVPIFQFVPPLTGLSANEAEQAPFIDPAASHPLLETVIPDSRTYPWAVSLAPGISRSTGEPVVFDANVVQDVVSRTKVNGVVFTHRLDYPWLEKTASTPEISRKPILAGAHCLVAPARLHLTLHHLTRAMETDPEFARKAQHAVDTLFRLKKWIHARQPTQAHPYRVFRKVHHPRHRQLARSLAEQGIVALKIGKLFGNFIGSTRRIVHYCLSFHESDKLSLFRQELEQRFQDVVWRSGTTEAKGADTPVSGSDRLLISFATPPDSSPEEGEVLSSLRNRLNAILAAKPGNSVAIFWGFLPPEVLSVVLQSVDTVLFAPDTTPPIQAALARAVSGVYPITGHLPVQFTDFTIRSVQYPGQPLQIVDAPDETPAPDTPFWNQTAHWLIRRHLRISQTVSGKSVFTVMPSIPLAFRFLVTGPLFLLAWKEHRLFPEDSLAHFFPKRMAGGGHDYVVDDLLRYRINWVPDSANGSDPHVPTISANSFTRSKDPVPDQRTEALLFAILQQVFGQSLEWVLNNWYQHSVMSLLECSPPTTENGQVFSFSPDLIQGLAQLLLYKGWNPLDRVITPRELDAIFEPFVWGLQPLGEKAVAASDRQNMFYLPLPQGWLFLNRNSLTQVFVSDPSRTFAPPPHILENILNLFHSRG